MTPEYEAVLQILYKRAGQNSPTKHIKATGLDQQAITSLITSQHLKRNRDGTVTLTKTGVVVAQGSNGKWLRPAQIPSEGTAMTPEQEAAMKLIFVRADQHKLAAHVNTLGINQNALVSLSKEGYLILNDDNTVTLTQGGAYAVSHLPPAAGTSPTRLDPDDQS